MAVKVAILGGTGGMGQWFANYFLGKGFDVVISGRFPEKTARVALELGVGHANSDVKAVLDADMVVVSMPIEVTAKSILNVACYMQKDAILYDLNSVKGDVIKALESAAKMGIRALSVHPLYGPGASNMRGQQVLLIPIKEDVHVVDEMSQMFKADGAVVHVLESGEVHDKMMALTLGLPHFLNILFAKVLAGNDIRDVKKFGGTTFKLQLLLAESVLSQDPNLYYAIQSQNPAFDELLTTVLTILKEMASSVIQKDKPRFIKNFKETTASISRDPEFSTAYQRFYKALDASQ
jgi:prephenate dehydrogenase